MKMNDGQTMRVQSRAQVAQRSVTLSRHTALSLAISIGRKGFSIIDYDSRNHYFCTAVVVKVAETLESLTTSYL